MGSPQTEEDIEAIKPFLNEGQNPSVIHTVYLKVVELLANVEKIINIFHQESVVCCASAVVTNKRLILHRPHIMGGADIEDWQWKVLAQPYITEGPIWCTFAVETRFDPKMMLGLERVPKAQARRLYTLAKEQELWWNDEWRFRKYEEERAKSGGMVLRGALAGMNVDPHPHPDLDQTTSQVFKEKSKGVKVAKEEPGQTPVPLDEPSGGIDPVARLKQLKELLDHSLITTEEYEAKRAEILKAI